MKWWFIGQLSFDSDIHFFFTFLCLILQNHPSFRFRRSFLHIFFFGFRRLTKQTYVARLSPQGPTVPLPPTSPPLQKSRKSLPPYLLVLGLNVSSTPLISFSAIKVVICTSRHIFSHPSPLLLLDAPTVPSALQRCYCALLHTHIRIRIIHSFIPSFFVDAH
ncbi:hypothetical protein BD410DRAFT_530597 [Rickenella mellea]|uniref:Uncharacterized protein n=1 Tax=Rickenella mellea TaxID=50990 RepID=A0A4Y7QIE7_9AGAM|nr:hypothetical protein BD410DRAFT_530597 [Rickenella mellea]